MAEEPSGRFIPCVLEVNGEPNARWKAKGYWLRLMLPTAWPRTSGEVSILRSPAAMENRLGPLRGVGEPSEVMLKLIVARLGSVGRWYRFERLQRSPVDGEDFLGFEGDCNQIVGYWANVQIICRTEAG